MIGVISKAGQRESIEEFFELFKTPWEWYHPASEYETVIITADEWPSDVKARLVLVYGTTAKAFDKQLGITECSRRPNGVLSDRDGAFPIYTGLLTFGQADNRAASVTTGGESAGIRSTGADGTILRLGYDVFDEVAFLLSTGQPAEFAEVPSLDLHIRMLREWILECGIPLVEIPPVPADRSFIVCLTHDIDFISIRQHFFDHSMWGFLFRATVGAALNFTRGRLSLTNLLRSWHAAGSLPFVYAGWARDFWEPFEWYLDVEAGMSPTYFLIPFKRDPGTRVPGRHAARRAAPYGVSELREVVKKLQEHDCEVGVHGIDSWHDAGKGAAEKAAVAAVAERCSGIRMHWLLQDENTPSTLERAGYRYDSTCGYNETVGYRAGTVQVFRPFGTRTLLELPLHIQDGALFYPKRLDLTEQQAEKRCLSLIEQAQRLGGVLTVLWHDRSHGPERFWGDFYKGLVAMLRARDAWFATAAQATDWFRQRRDVRFERIGARSVGVTHAGGEIQPPVRIRVHRPSNGTPEPRIEVTDASWNGNEKLELDALSGLSVTAPSLCP